VTTDRQASKAATATDPAVEAELDRLPTTPIADLRKRYRELFRTEPPKAFGPDLLRRSIAQRIQEKAYGGLPTSTRRLLDQFVKTAMAKPNGTFASLSEIASEITGTRWNGPRFFGLARRNGTSTRNNNKKSVCPTDQGPAA
jgi:hypothetical protein